MAEPQSLPHFSRRCYRIAPEKIAMLRFLVEGYDGLLFLRTREARAALVELSWAEACTADAEALLAALESELGLAPVSA